MLKKIDIQMFDYVFTIMDNSFPNTEMRTYNEQKKLLYDDRYSILVKENDNKIIAFICYWNLNNFSYVEHFAVDKNQRGNNIGSKMLMEFCKMQDKPIVLEVEYPENEMAIRRINFYKRNEFFMNDYEYIQPPLRDGDGFLPLKIMSFKRNISKCEFIELKNDLYSIVYKYKK